MKSAFDMSKHQTKRSLLKYSLPSVVMIFIYSFYEIIDGLFISNFVGATAFAAVNIAMPLFIILAAYGLMMGAGSSALIGNKLGEKDTATANKYFSMCFYFTIFVGVLLGIFGWFVSEPILLVLGAEGELLEIALYYARVSMIAIFAYVALMAFMVWFNTAGKPVIGMINALVSCVVIALLNSILTGFLGLGINGALIATITCEFLGFLIPVIYFSKPRKGCMLHLVSPRQAFKNQNPSTGKVLLKAHVNGCGEIVTEISVAVVILFTIYQINIYIGENGIVAYGIIDYVWIVFNAFYMGYSVAIAPLISYQQGAKNPPEMQSLFKNSLVTIIVSSVVIFALAEIFAPAIVGCFVSYDQGLMELSVYAFRIYSISFLLAGYSILGTNIFASIGEGVTSVVVAVCRTLIFEASCLMIFPMIFGADGIWWAIGISEGMATILTTVFLIVKGRKHQLIPGKMCAS